MLWAGGINVIIKHKNAVYVLTPIIVWILPPKDLNVMEQRADPVAATASYAEPLHHNIAYVFFITAF